MLKTDKYEMTPFRETENEVHSQVRRHKTGGTTVLVGTYRKGQLSKWPGYYNYPLTDSDHFDIEYAKNVNEIWLFRGTSDGRYFGAKFLGLFNRNQLRKQFGYPGNGKAHGSTYLLYELSECELPGPSTNYADAVIVRASDFATAPDIRRQIKQYLESPDRRDPSIAKLVPSILSGISRDSLHVCETFEQLDFFESLNRTDILPPFPTPRITNFSFVDLFAGVGGIRMGFQNVGGRCVFSSEWNASAAETYCRNFGEMPHGDIQKISEDSIPDHDVLCAGFPCQPFSISGKQKGFDDIRGTMFFEICRILKRKTPKIVFLENVKHLVHHDNGRTLSVILEKLRELGYNTSWKVLNAVDFGVPQNRERIIIVGSRRGVFDFSSIRTEGRRSLLECLDKDNGANFDFLSPSEYTLIPSPKMQEGSGLMFAGYRNKSIRKVGVRPGTLHLSRVHKQPNRIYSVLGIHPTLPSQESSGRFFIRLSDDRVRKLTLHECWRIMGFPEEYIKVSSPGEQYRQLGNSVCVPMITAVAHEIKRQFLD